MTPYRLALALPLLLVLVSDAWAQATQPNTTQAPPAATADQQAASDEPIGNVATLTGSATVTRNNTATPLQLKDDIYLNDVVATAASSSLGITFNDATTFTLKANAQVTVDNYVYEDGGKTNSGIFDIAKGTVAFAAAAVAKTGSMQITTPTAALGIRGTTGLVEVPEGGAAATTANNIKLYPDADGHVGQIEVNDRQGRRLGALTTGASGFAIRGGPGWCALRCRAACDLAATGHARPGFRAPATRDADCRPTNRHPAARLPPRQSAVSQSGATAAARATKTSRPAATGHAEQPSGSTGRAQSPGPATTRHATTAGHAEPARSATAGRAATARCARTTWTTSCRHHSIWHAQPNALPRTPGAPPTPTTPGVGPRTGAAPGTPPGVTRPGGLRPRLPGLPKGKPPPPEKKRR